MKTKIIILGILSFSACFFHVTTVSAQRVIQVVDLKSRTGVRSEIFRRSSTGNETSLGDTNAQGEKKIPVPGAAGERLRAVPKSPRYYDSSTDCPLQAKQTIVEVVAIDSIGGIGQRMLAKARSAEAAGKPAEAALALKELVQYTASSDPALASLLQKRILDLGGEIFYVQTPALPQRNEMKWAATPRLEERVRDFQKISGLSVNGTLDKPTLAKAAERENYTARTTTTTHGY
jgi:hypothetical protein